MSHFGKVLKLLRGNELQNKAQIIVNLKTFRDLSLLKDFVSAESDIYLGLKGDYYEK